MKWYVFYTITLRNFVVTETHIVLIISFLLVLFTQFILDIK